MNRKRKNNIIIASLCAVIIIMGVGYAAFASRLNITGTSNITSNFAVKIIDIKSTFSGGASNATEPTYNNTTASFSTNLVSPGDYAEYTITVENQGSVDATLSDIQVNTGNNDAIVFETSGLNEGDNLLQGESAELLIKVSYNSGITSQPTNTTNSMTVTLTYEQISTETAPETGNVRVVLLYNGSTLTTVGGTLKLTSIDNNNDYSAYVGDFNSENYQLLDIPTGDYMIEVSANDGFYGYELASENPIITVSKGDNVYNLDIVRNTPGGGTAGN